MKKLKHSVISQFEVLDDPRVKREPKHLLVDIVTIAILAVLSGADNMVAIETYGISFHDTFSRVLALIDPKQLHECFLSWVQQIAHQLEIKLINIDGKTTRGSYDRNKQLNQH